MSEIRQGACHLCEASCGLRIEVDQGRVLSIRGDEQDPLSAGHLCPKALALPDVRDDPDRLRGPVRRTSGGEWEPIGWDEAFDLVVRRLAETRERHGPDAVATYLGNPFVHNLGAVTHGPPFIRMLGTRNAYSASSLDQWPQLLVCSLLYGNQWLLPIPDIDRTSYFLMFGANPAVSNGSMMTAPGIGRRLRELSGRGGRTVLFDPRRTETARLVDEHHFVRPGTDAALLLAMVRVILDEDLASPPPYLDGLARVADAVRPFTPAAVAEVTGVPVDTIERIACEFATASGAACYGRLGVSTQSFGALCQWAIQLLNLVTGNLDRPGGVLFTRPALDPIAGGLIESGRYGRWRSRVRALPEFGGELPAAALAEEIRTPGDGQVRALVTVAGNPVLSAPGGDQLDQALDGLDFQVAVDFYVNETTRHADVILPPTDALERDHYDLVFNMLSVRNTARFTPAVFGKPDGARHDWEIFAELGRRYHRRTRAGALRDRMLLRMTPTTMLRVGLLTGPYRLGLGKLRRNPHGIDLGPLRPSLPGRLATANKRIDAAPELLIADLARAEAELLGSTAPTGLRLIGRRHLRSNNSWMHNSERLTKGKPRHQLLMHPDDLAARGLPDSGPVELTSAAGSIRVEAVADPDLMPGTVSLPHGYGHERPGVLLATARAIGGSSVNDVTDPARLDGPVGTAVLNGVPVEVRSVALPASSESQVSHPGPDGTHRGQARERESARQRDQAHERNRGS